MGEKYICTCELVMDEIEVYAACMDDAEMLASEKFAEHILSGSLEPYCECEVVER